MENIEFDEVPKFIVKGKSEKIPFFPKILINAKIAKDVKTANIYLLVFALLCIVLAIFIAVHFVFAKPNLYHKGFIDIPSGSPAYSKTYLKTFNSANVQ